MGAIWMRLRAELRSRWVAWLGLATVIGLFAGIVLTSIVGARRTETAYDRFLREMNAWDAVTFYAAFDPSFAIFEHDEVRAIPVVEDSLRASFYEVEGEMDAVASDDPRFGRSFQAVKIVAGRAADPARANEITMPYERVEELGIDPGEEVTLTMTRARPTEQGMAPGSSVQVTFDVVGVHVMPGDFPPRTGEDDPYVLLTPAFNRERGRELFRFGTGFFQLQNGTDSFGEFHDGLDELADGKPFFAISQADQTAIADDALGLVAAGLRALGSILALVGILAFAQAISRQTVIDSDGFTAARALGMTASELWLVGLLRALVIGLAAALVALGTGIALSPLTPVGIARIVEPRPGAVVDVAVLAWGLAVIAGTVLLLSVYPAHRAARFRSDRENGPNRRSRLAQLAFRSGGGPTVVSGIRLALERGRGNAAVPVLTTIGTAAVGLGALAMAATLGSSLDRVLNAPELYGMEWHFEAQIDTEGFRAQDSPSFAVADKVREIDGVEQVAVMDAGVPLTVDGVSAAGVVYDPREPRLAPDLLRGRIPADANEVAVGERTLRSLGKTLGDQVEVTLAGLPPVRFEVVGTAALPGYVTADSVGEGSMLHPDGLLRMFADPPPPSSLQVRLEPGADAVEIRRQIQALPRVQELGDPWVPSAIANLSSLRGLQTGIAAALALLALAAIVHALLSSVRRRRRELAVLRALGFVRGQVAATVGWQALTLAAAALLLGVPAGLGVGRWLWSAAAREFGVIAVPSVPWLALAFLIPGALLAALIASIGPARSAARTRPAVVLRAE